MKKYVSLLLSTIVAISLLLSAFSPVISLATDTKHYMGTVVNTGHDTGFSENNSLTKKDPHFSWTLGRFYVDGYTRRIADDSNDTPIFLKTVGDTVTLWFELQQDINKLNGDDMLSICGDPNGYDEYFGIEKTNMGRGTLIIRHTDYQNHTSDPIIYTNYLEASAKKDAAVEVKLCEEGDYEVALNYEIRKDNVDLFGWNPFPSYYNYRIFFRFSVRNGNCMVYPFDVSTGAELNNTAITENGFYLDLAKSRYLNINIKKEILTDGADGLTEDVRFNKPAKDGEQFTEEGIYTITANNIYTNQTTTKIIYVGTNKILKAHVVTGYPINEIKYQLSLGATITEDGLLIAAPEHTLPTLEESTPTDTTSYTESEKANDSSLKKTESSAPKTHIIWITIIIVALSVTVATISIIRRKKNTTTTHEETETINRDDNEEVEE